MEKEIEYVQAELWSGEYAEMAQNQDDVASKNNRNMPNNTTERSQRQSDSDVNFKGDEIGLDKKRKEKLAKEKQKKRKEKLAKEKAEKEKRKIS